MKRQPIEDGKIRGGYRCKKCQQIKKGHICLGSVDVIDENNSREIMNEEEEEEEEEEGQEEAAAAVEEVKLLSVSSQVELNPLKTLRALGDLALQGLPESYFEAKNPSVKPKQRTKIKD